MTSPTSARQSCLSMSARRHLLQSVFPLLVRNTLHDVQEDTHYLGNTFVGLNPYYRCNSSVILFPVLLAISESFTKTYQKGTFRPIQYAVMCSRVASFLMCSVVVPAGESGSADTVRDPRGFAVKFYTEEGNWDLTGNNTPVFFIRDALLVNGSGLRGLTGNWQCSSSGTPYW